MKDLKNFINEAVEFETIKTEYREYGVVTLVRRENVDCANISKEDFVKFIREDINTAVEEYAKIVKPLNDQKVKDSIEREIKNAISFAEKKWKTQKKRDEYVENAKKNIENKKWYLEDPKRIFFDFKPDTGRMGIPVVCTLSYDSDDKQLERCYEELVNGKYFKRGTGWAFKYESRSKDKINVYSFRPYVDLLLNESDREEQKRDAKNLSDSIERFYSNSNYWGD